MKKSLAKTTVFLIVFLLSNSVLSQQGEYIIGRLLDAKTQEPIAFASIRIKDRALGIISNTDGSFKIPMKYKEYGDIIEISSMGYQTKEVLIHDLSIYELNNVRLQPEILLLEEAVVTAKKKRKKKLSAGRIVRRAIKAIPENYPVEPFSTVGYYRDYQLDSLQYVNLNEAILEVFDQGFNKIDQSTTRIRIYDYVQNKEFERDSLSEKPYNYRAGSKIIDNAFLPGYGGNEFTLLRVHDAIRNYQLNSYDFINEMMKGDVLKNHSVKRQADTNLDNNPLYVIELNRNKNGYVAKGIAYIAKADFAIYKLEYAVYDKNSPNKSVRLGENGVADKLIFEVTTEYKRGFNNKMFLNYISFHNTFRLRQPPKFTLKTLGVHLDRNYFKLTFNNKIDEKNALQTKNYIGVFKGRRIKFEKLVLLENLVLLYPKLNTKKQINIWKELESIGVERAFEEKLIYFEVKNIKDIQGNLINEEFSKNYNQFREFFVQEVKLNPHFPPSNLLMQNQKPLYEGQPISRPDNFDDYWMNTPLPNIKN